MFLVLKLISSYLSKSLNEDRLYQGIKLFLFYINRMCENPLCIRYRNCIFAYIYIMLLMLNEDYNYYNLCIFKNTNFLINNIKFQSSEVVIYMFIIHLISFIIQHLVNSKYNKSLLLLDIIMIILTLIITIVFHNLFYLGKVEAFNYFGIFIKIDNFYTHALFSERVDNLLIEFLKYKNYSAINLGDNYLYIPEDVKKKWFYEWNKFSNSQWVHYLNCLEFNISLNNFISDKFEDYYRPGNIQFKYPIRRVFKHI